MKTGISQQLSDRSGLQPWANASVCRDSNDYARVLNVDPIKRCTVGAPWNKNWRGHRGGNSASKKQN